MNNISTPNLVYTNEARYLPHPIAYGSEGCVLRRERSFFDQTDHEYWTTTAPFEFHLKSENGDPGQPLLQLLHRYTRDAREVTKGDRMLSPAVVCSCVRGIPESMCRQQICITGSLINGILREDNMFKSCRCCIPCENQDREM